MKHGLVRIRSPASSAHRRPPRAAREYWFGRIHSDDGLVGRALVACPAAVTIVTGSGSQYPSTPAKTLVFHIPATAQDMQP